MTHRQTELLRWRRRTLSEVQHVCAHKREQFVSMERGQNGLLPLLSPFAMTSVRPVEGL